MIVDFADFTPDLHAAEAGNKAATLARLHCMGLPVPPGFIIASGAFEPSGLKVEHGQEAEARFAALKAHANCTSVAVRSSVLHEDSQHAAHAGEFTSILNVGDAAALHAAIAAVHASARGAPLAVIVQQQVEPEYAGVMFTVDPVSGDDSKLLGNFVAGLADALLSGDRDALLFSIDRRSGAYEGDPALRSFASMFIALAETLERSCGSALDIEWAVRDGRCYVLQCRSVTAVGAAEPYNDSLAGDWLWTNTNTGEAFAGTLTPLSATAMVGVINGTMGSFNGLAMAGLIAGRLYLNLSWSLAIYARMGMTFEAARQALALVGGTIPAGITIPEVRISYGSFLAFVGRMVKYEFQRLLRGRRWLHWYREECPSWCEACTARIAACSNRDELLTIFQELIAQAGGGFALLVATMNAMARERVAIEKRLFRELSKADAEVLLAGIGQGAALASLQPLLKFSAVMRGELSREEFLRGYGHRSDMELELAAPRPAEDPAWLDTLARQWANSAPEALVGTQHEARERIWAKLGPKGRSLRRQYERSSRLMRDRELIRSESMRLSWLQRKMVLKAAALDGLTDELFFLEVPELAAYLGGDASALARVPARRHWYERYRALPRLPSYISGSFHPFMWQRDPARRTDLFDAHVARQPRGAAAVSGFAGSPGVVEGFVRILESPQQFAELLDGEVLVTSHTNIGWTLVFPRVAAIVTDIGAPLSHTAIVARELGIPAVVGTGVATSRLKTGDRVRVDGSSGTVEILPH